MIKNLITLFILFSLFACNQAEKKTTPPSVVKNDTSEWYHEENYFTIPKGFSVDTIIESDRKSEYSRMFIFPKLTEPVFNELNKVLTNEIKRKAVLCYGDTADAPINSTDEIFDAVEDIKPLKMYKSEKLVSYGFINIFGEPGMMRPFRKYFTVNYDAGKSEFISFDDYFSIQSSEDSAFLKQLIFGVIGNPDISRGILGNEINFSIDDEKVYFYYDMFSEMGNPMGLVYGFKKKYLLKFIKEEYK